MLEYARAAWITWLLGFTPYVEIFAAIPVGIRLGLSPVSAVPWAVFGNFVPIPLIFWFFDIAKKREITNKWLVKFDNWLRKFNSYKVVARFTGLLHRNFRLFIVLIAPVIGVWAIAVVADLLLKIGRRQILIYSLIGLIVYGVLTGLAAHAGFEWFRRIHTS